MSKDGCTGKRRHADKTAACIAASRMKSVAMNVYRCDRCKGWHVGRTRDPYRTVARIDQILRRHKLALDARLRDRDRHPEGEKQLGPGLTYREGDGRMSMDPADIYGFAVIVLGLAAGAIFFGTRKNDGLARAYAVIFGAGAVAIVGLGVVLNLR